MRARAIRSFLIVVAMIAISSVATVASAQPLVDGIVYPSEWAGADAYPLKINLPEGGTTSGTLYITNDATDLYIGIVYQRSTIDAVKEIYVALDAQGNGLPTDGDDAIGLSTQPECDPPQIFDGYFTFVSPPCPFPNSPSPCLPGDDEPGGRGTIDGNVASSRNGTSMMYEMRHPLASGDPRDMRVGSGMKLKFYLYVMLQNAAANYAQTVDYDRYVVR
jgi:hypothetical protein